MTLSPPIPNECGGNVTGKYEGLKLSRKKTGVFVDYDGVPSIGVPGAKRPKHPAPFLRLHRVRRLERKNRYTNEM